MPEITGVIVSNQTDGVDGELNSMKWKDMSLSQLWNQYNILNARLMAAQQLQHEQLIRGMEQGMNILNEIIKRRSAESDKIDLM